MCLPVSFLFVTGFLVWVGYILSSSILSKRLSAKLSCLSAAEQIFACKHMRFSGGGGVRCGYLSVSYHVRLCSVRLSLVLIQVRVYSVPSLQTSRSISLVSLLLHVKTLSYGSWSLFPLKKKKKKS